MKSGKLSWKRIHILVLLALISSCAKDVDEESRRRDKLAERLAQFSEVTGVYRGVLFSRSTGAPLGAMALQLKAETRAGRKDQDYNSEQVPVLRGVVLIEGLSKGVVQFPDSAYKSDNKTLNVTIPVNLTTTQCGAQEGTLVDLDIEGRFEGDTLKGHIEAFGYSDAGGDFELSKNGPAVEPGKLLGPQPKEDKAPSFVRDAGIYEGKIKLEGDTEELDAVLTVSNQGRCVDQKIADLLMPVQWLLLSLTLDGSRSISFFNSQWDSRLQTLNGKVRMEEAELSLQCEELTLSDDSRKGLRCKYFSSRGYSQIIDFKPRKKTSGPDKPKP